MYQVNGVNGNLALDSRSLDTLRLQAKLNPEQALKAVSQQFEAVFLQTMLKSMRDATPQDGLMDSDQTRQYTAMLDQQMAQNLSSKGVGLADVMLNQLQHGKTVEADGPPALPPAAVNAKPVVNTTSAIDVPSPNKVEHAKTAAADVSENFLLRLKEYALQASAATGIPAKFLLGHAALESGWGRHEIRNADGSPSHNLFGIKASRHWKGATVDVMTTEYVNGAPRKMVQKFRAYASYAEAFQDYASLLHGSPRYAAVLKQSDSAGFAQGLQRAGYATDPRYAQKLTQILEGARMHQAMVA